MPLLEKISLWKSRQLFYVFCVLYVILTKCILENKFNKIKMSMALNYTLQLQ